MDYNFEKIDYSIFANKCLDELKIVQKKFKDEYNLNWYQNWFYNQATGLLTFSTEDVELNFRYFQAGSFSKKSNTWKWSWDNYYTLERVKEQTKLIKDFGQRYNMPKLTNGYFKSDEFEAWELTAIATKLSEAIGVYRPVNDDGIQIFLIITELVDNEVAQEIKDKYVECSDHEYRRRAFVCQHLNRKTKVGFEEAFETFEDMELLEDDDFQAWCNECELVRSREDGWNDESMAFANIKI
jgi:hypothetical protein